MQKVGIMGGTFNPIHYGHLFLAQQALEQMKLDKILFMPSKNPPHKKKQEIVSDQCRKDMIRLAIMGNPQFELSSLEFEREGTTYTADTLTILTQENPDTEYYFIIGADSLFMMQNWKAPQTVFRLSTILVAGRDRVNQSEMDEKVKFYEDIYQARIFFVEMPAIEISSAAIRTRLGEKKTIRYYVPDHVMEYIAENDLYR
ncbi:MAG: hypothetical protein K0S76_2144 [Herbinix sp.]|jgi:nicotinate-nucleotide adenylyltransferase|nr:hypothetical protein [Herbinix sp.]